MAIQHQDNFSTQPTSAILAGATTSPLNDIPSVDAPFYLAFDATDANGHYEVVYVTSKTETNVNHAALTYAHSTDEIVRMVVPATELDEIQTLITTGWTPSGETWTYASATTFTIAGTDLTSKYTTGTKIKLTNDSTTKYFYVVTSSFSTNTTVTVTGEVDLASGAITNPFYSYADCPQGFKRGQDWYSARAVRTSQQVLNDNTTTILEFNSEEYDPNGNFSSDTYTAPISGKYSINAKVYVYDNSAKMVAYIFYLYKNGSAYDEYKHYPTNAVGAAVNFTPTAISTLSLNKGDTIKLALNIDTSDSSAVAIGVSSLQKNFLEVNFIGI